MFVENSTKSTRIINETFPKVVISTARGVRDFPAIFAEPLWDDSGSDLAIL